MSKNEEFNIREFSFIWLVKNREGPSIIQLRIVDYGEDLVNLRFLRIIFYLKNLKAFDESFCSLHGIHQTCVNYDLFI